MASRPGPPNTSGTGPVRLRQVAFVARDLERARDLLTYIIGTEVIYVDPTVEQWGLHNILVPVGGDIIEVVSPFKPGTTAGRLLDKRKVDAAGYMVIMQTGDAEKRREYIEKKGLAKVIYNHRDGDSSMVQYHPKGIKGGVMPELDSHDATNDNPTPIQTRFSPWHPCGPDQDSVIAAMKRHSHLSLVGLVCRLAPNDWGSEPAASLWEEAFGVPRSRDQLAFTNARMGFLHGEENQSEGMISISIGVKGEKKRDEIFQRAKEKGVLSGDRARRWVDMLGVKWYFVVTGADEGDTQSKL